MHGQMNKVVVSLDVVQMLLARDILMTPTQQVYRATKGSKPYSARAREAEA